MTQLETTARNATLNDVVEILKRQADARYDVVTPASLLRYEGPDLVITGSADMPVLTESGVDMADVRLRPTQIFDDQMAGRLEIPVKYFRRMRESAAGLLTENVNHWLARDNRTLLVRGFRVEGDDGPGIARAVLSDRFGGAADHLDSLTAMFAGVAAAGIDVEVAAANLSEKALRVRVRAPQIGVLAPELLRGYRSPFSGKVADENPLVFAGFQFDNSETGHGAYSLAPVIEVEICGNGMTMTKEAYRKVHLGSRLEAGKIAWSHETHQAHLELIKNETKDTVTRFLDIEWLQSKVDEITGKAQTEVTNPTKAIEVVSKQLGYTEAEQALILSDFIKGGQTTSGGIAQAITATAQRLDDPDRAAHLEGSALDAMLAVA